MGQTGFKTVPKYGEVIHKNLKIIIYHVAKIICHTPLKSCRHITKSKQYALKHRSVKGTDDSGFLLVLQMNFDFN